GACSGTVTVQSQDTFGNPSNVAAATTVNLATTSTGGVFYSSSTCTTASATAVIAAGTSTQSFWFKDTKSGSPTESASATGLATATQIEAINPAAAAALVFATAAQTVVAGACSGVATVQS